MFTVDIQKQKKTHVATCLWTNWIHIHNINISKHSRISKISNLKNRMENRHEIPQTVNMSCKNRKGRHS